MYAAGRGEADVRTGGCRDAYCPARPEQARISHFVDLLWRAKLRNKSNGPRAGRTRRTTRSVCQSAIITSNKRYVVDDDDDDDNVLVLPPSVHQPAYGGGPLSDRLRTPLRPGSRSTDPRLAGGRRTVLV
jgi:hypothetical protein